MPESHVNAHAIDRAELAHEMRDWLYEVNDQVEPRLDRVKPGWRDAVDQPDVVEACTFGLLLGRLAELYPDTKPALSLVADQHPSFTSLPDGRRLDTLQSLASEPTRALRWLGPLLEIDDPQQMRELLD